MKRLLTGLALLCALASPAWSAGSIPIALSQQFNSNGAPLVNCQLFIYQVGTVATPQTAFQDTALTVQLPWPVTCDQNGRLPMFYLADGSVHTRLTDSAGVVQFDYPSMLVIGPSSGGGGGGGTIDPTTIASTGDIKFRATSETLTGWVRVNGRTVGNATSGATERANADTSALFTYLWQNCIDAHCPVGGGRGASASADFAASKTITLPDWRARIPVGLDDMGNTAAGRLLASNITSGGGDGVTTPMATGGEANHAIAQAELPNVTLTTSIASGQGSHNHNLDINGGAQSTSVTVGQATGQAPNSAGLGQATGSTLNIHAATLPSMTGTTPLGGSGTAGNNLPPFALGTWFIKL